MATTVDTLLVRIEADMADLKRDLDRVAKQSESVGERMKRSFRGVGAALAAVGGVAVMGQFIKASVQTGMSVENLRVQMNALLGSVDEGGKAFKMMTEFAAGVPFSLDQIQAGSGSLAAAADNADELRELMQITGNIAAQFGIPFEMAAENVQRALSAGAASADLFQQKGVNAFMGFQAGVSYSSGETAKVLQATFGTGGTSDGAMAEFAKTTSGALSMFQDAMFKMRRAFAEGGLNEAFSKIVKSLENLAIALIPVMKGLGQLVNSLASVVAPIIQGLADNLMTVGIVLAALAARFVLVKVQALAFSATIYVVSAAQAALAVHTATATSALTFMQKGIVIARAGLIGLGTALSAVGKLMMRFLPIAVLTGLAYAVQLFIQLKNGAGGLSEAFGLLSGALKAFVDIQIARFDKLILTLYKFAQGFKRFFASIMISITDNIRKGLNFAITEMNKVIPDFMKMDTIPASAGFVSFFRDMMDTADAAILATDTQISVLNTTIDDLKERFAETKQAIADAFAAGDENAVVQREAELKALGAAIANLSDDIATKLTPQMSTLLDGVQQVGDGVTSSFRDMLDGAKFSMASMTDLVKTAVKDMIAQLFRLMVVNNAINAMFGGVAGFTPLNSIPLFPSTPAQAGGGTLQRGVPTLVGERGPELIVPNGASTILNGQNTRGALSGGGGTIVNQTINIETGVAQTVKAEMLTMLPQFKKDTMAAVLDAKRRGGTYGRGFA